MGGSAMSSFEWMELQTLTAEIAAARSRLAAFRSRKDQPGARALQEEITGAEERRDRLLAHISTNLSSEAEAAASPPPAAAAADLGAVAEASDAGPAEPETAQNRDEPADPAPATGPEPPVAAVTDDIQQGAAMSWDQLTPNDLEHAKHELGVRRAEMLARHAEELTALEADRAELATLEDAIGAFLRKFNASANGIVKLEEKREMRQQGRA